MNQDNSFEGNPTIVMHLKEGENTGKAMILHGQAPKQLDNLAPVKIDIQGVIHAPLEFLKHRVNDIDQHKAHILVNRDNLTIILVICEDDPYLRGEVMGKLQLSRIFINLGINTNKQWEPAQLGQFLKLNRAFFTSREDCDRVVNALKSFNAKVNQTIERETKENGNRAQSFRQAVDSNIPEKFTLRIPVVSGGQPCEIEVETYATIDGQSVSVALQSPGANEIVEDVRNNYIGDIIDQIRSVAPEIVIIEQ